MKNSPQSKGGELSDKSFDRDFQKKTSPIKTTKQAKGRIPQEFISELKLRLCDYMRNVHSDNIVEDYGDTLKMRCPYHDDKKPSATVFISDEGTPLFHCYSSNCGFSGDITKCAERDAEEE